MANAMKYGKKKIIETSRDDAGEEESSDEEQDANPRTVTEDAVAVPDDMKEMEVLVGKAAKHVNRAKSQRELVNLLIDKAS
jgi:hypothetical protein